MERKKDLTLEGKVAVLLHDPTSEQPWGSPMIAKQHGNRLRTEFWSRLVARQEGKIFRQGVV